MHITGLGDTLDARKLVGPHSSLGAGVAIYLAPASREDFPRTPGCHPVDLTGGYWFEPCGARGEKTRVVNVATIDPHAFLPQWFLNFVIANIAYLILPMLRSQTKHFALGGKLRDRIDGKPHVYGEIQRRLDELVRTRQTTPFASSSFTAGKAGFPPRLQHQAHKLGSGGGGDDDDGSRSRGSFRRVMSSAWMIFNWLIGFVVVNVALPGYKFLPPFLAFVRCVSPYGGDVFGWALDLALATASRMPAAAPIILLVDLLSALKAATSGNTRVYCASAAALNCALAVCLHSFCAGSAAQAWRLSKESKVLKRLTTFPRRQLLVLLNIFCLNALVAALVCEVDHRGQHGMKADQQETLAERVISACIYVLLSTTNGGAVAETESITLSDQGLAAVELALGPILMTRTCALGLVAVVVASVMG